MPAVSSNNVTYSYISREAATTNEIKNCYDTSRWSGKRRLSNTILNTVYVISRFKWDRSQTRISFSTGEGEPVRDSGGSSPSGVDGLLAGRSFCLRKKQFTFFQIRFKRNTTTVCSCNTAVPTVKLSTRSNVKCKQSFQCKHDTQVLDSQTVVVFITRSSKRQHFFTYIIILTNELLNASLSRLWEGCSVDPDCFLEPDCEIDVSVVALLVWPPTSQVLLRTWPPLVPEPSKARQCTMNYLVWYESYFNNNVMLIECQQLANIITFLAEVQTIFIHVKYWFE
jgi:hypothetical protein